MHSITRCITAHYMMNNIDLYNTTDIRLFRATTIIYSLLIRADYPPLSIPILWKRCFKATFQMLNHLSHEQQTLDLVRKTLSVDNHLFIMAPLPDILNATWDVLRSESVSAKTWAIITRAIMEFAPIREIMTLHIGPLEEACMKWQPTEDVIYEMKDAAIKKYTDDYKEFKDELLTVAMHPLRIIDWYLPNEDKAKWGVSTKR